MTRTCEAVVVLWDVATDNREHQVCGEPAVGVDYGPVSGKPYPTCARHTPIIMFYPEDEEPDDD